MAVFNVVTCFPIPVAHFAIVVAPSMNSVIAHGDLSLMTSLALEVGGLVHVAVDTATDSGDSIGGSKTV